MSDYQLILGDCLDKMSLIEDGSVDMILADLPYGTTACKWDTVIPFESLWTHYKRVIKRRGAVVLFGTFPFTAMLWASNPGWYKYQWVWNKNNSAGFFLAKFQPFIITEDILVFCNGKTTYNPQMTNGVMRYKGYGGKTSEHHPTPPCKGESKNDTYYPKNIINISKINQKDNLHPTQKPVTLLEYLIKTYTNEGETVLDNVMGSGSTGEACLRTGRRFIGIEKDPGYFEIAKNRLERVAAELRGELNHLPMFEGLAV